MNTSGLFWLLSTLLPLVVLQRLLHREIQSVLLILTRSPQLAIGLFSVLFFPGVLLHELSHYLMARLLGVGTHGFSLVPDVTPDGNLQMGFVETEPTDIFRDSLIGLAPLIAGSLFVSYAGINRLQLLSLWQPLLSADFGLFLTSLGALPAVPDFYLWFYLAFTVSSTMLPSASDRLAWIPLAIWASLLLVLGILAGAGEWMLENLTPALNLFMNSASTLFGLSAGLHLALLPPVLFLHKAFARLTGIDAR